MNTSRRMSVACMLHEARAPPTGGRGWADSTGSVYNLGEYSSSGAPAASRILRHCIHEVTSCSYVWGISQTDIGFAYIRVVRIHQSTQYAFDDLQATTCLETKKGCYYNAQYYYRCIVVRSGRHPISSTTTGSSKVVIK